MIFQRAFYGASFFGFLPSSLSTTESLRNVCVFSGFLTPGVAGLSFLPNAHVVARPLILALLGSAPVCWVRTGFFAFV